MFLEWMIGIIIGTLCLMIIIFSVAAILPTDGQIRGGIEKCLPHPEAGCPCR